MSNLGILLKNSIKCMFGALQGKKSRKKFGLVLTFCILGYIGISLVFALQIFELFETMGAIGLGQVPLFNSFQIAIMIIVIVAFQSLSEKGQTNDSDFLLSMPIKKIDIVISKTLSKYLFNLALISMVIIPTIILYSVYIELSFLAILWCVLLMLIIPLLGVGINYILNFVITRFFNRTKFATLFKTLIAIILFGGYMAIYIYSSTIMGLQNITTIDSFLNSNFLAGLCVRIVYDNNLLNLLYLCLIIFGIFAIGLLCYSIIFGKSYEAYHSNKSKVKFSSAGLWGGLLRKEIKKYFTTPILLVNTIISPIAMIVITIFVAIKGRIGINDFFFGMEDEVLSLFMCVWLILCASTLISCSSISLEGKYLWILKCTPVDPKLVLFAKSLLNMIIYLPVHLTTSIIIVVIMQEGLMISIAFVLLPILLNIILSFGGTYINLLLPKLEWESETQVVKQSLSLVLTMIIGYVLAFVPIIFGLLNIASNLSLIITLCLYALLASLSIILLSTRGVKKFNKLTI